MSARHGFRPFRFPLGALSVLLALVLAGCSDESLTQPVTDEGLPAPAVSLLPGDPGGLSGCASVLVTRSGRKDLSAAVSARSGCGELSIQLDSVTFDDKTNWAALHMRIRNGGSARGEAPALLASWPDSMRVVTPPGLAGNRHTSKYLTQVAPDSTLAADHPRWPGANVWTLGLATGPAGDPGSAQTYGPATLSIAVHPGVRSFEVVLHTHARQVIATVPEDIPASLPADLLNRVDSRTGVPVDYVAVMFASGTPVAEKTRTVSLVSGQVTGGRPFREGSLLGGYYLVKVPTDGTLGPVLNASEVLAAEPSVVNAVPVIRTAAASRTPDDGGAWSEWQTDPYRADGENLALELIGAPLAWGCVTGDATVPIAVIDRGFYPLDDLVPNVSSADYDMYSFPHGTSVASVLAARGNNEQGMTGVMWNAGLSLVAMTDDWVMGMVDALEAAVLGGEKILNMSLQHPWAYSPGTPEDRRLVFATYRSFASTLEYLRDEEQQTIPLVVVSAGNHGPLDAWWSGYPRAVEDFPDNVIVVGSVAAGPPSPLGTLAMASSSSPGDLVEIAAPGDGVSVLVPGAGGGPGRVVPGSGTSFAAPMVAGVAGLLLSFDPTIPVDQLKALILEGARTDGFSAVPQLPVLHAYGALKAAARRTGAPVCGNTVVADGTQILVDRGDSWDEIGNSSVPSFHLAVQHGSRAIDIFTPSGPLPTLERAEFFSGEWSVTQGPAPDPEIPFPPAGSFDPGGFSRSQGGESDDGLASAYASRKLDAPVDEAEWGVRLNGPEGITEVYRHHQSLTAALDTICTRKYVARDPDTGEVILTYCNRMSRIYRGESAEASASMAPQGGRIYLTVVISNVSYSLGGWAPCGFEVECLTEISSVSSARSHVHEIDIAEETAREVFQVPHAIYRLGVSEDGKDIVFGRYDASSTGSSNSITRAWFRCTVEVRDTRSGQLRRTAPFERSCFSTSGGGGPYDVPILSFGHGS